MIVTGSIIDRATGNILKNCEIQQFMNGAGFGVHILVPDGNFSIDVSLDPNTYFIFSCPGYALLYANTVDILANGSDNYNAFLTVLTSNAGKTILPLAAGLGLFLLANKKNKVGAVTKENAMPFVYFGGAIIGYIVLRKLLIELHLIDSPETKVLDAASNDPTSFWNPNYYKQFTTFTYSITRAEAEQLVRQIEDSFGPVNDCEECAIAVFHTLKTKAQVSYLSDIFYQQTSNDLLTYLRGGSWPEDRLSDTDVAGLQSFINNLPTH